MSHRPIGIFDSGLGGISILKEIHKRLPSEHLIYIADSAYAPYGDKDKQSILQRSQKVVEYLLACKIKALVIACNTATVVAANHLRKQFPDLIIIGLEPAIKPAVKTTKQGVIGILATEQTIKSQRLQQLIHTYAKNIRIEKQACSGLVEQVEAGEFNSDKTQKLLADYINPMLIKGVDTLVLGCTHYPFLMDSINRLSNGSVKLLETSVPVTQQLQRILVNKGLQQVGKLGKVDFYSSELTAKQQNIIEKLWQGTIQIQQLPKPYC